MANSQLSGDTPTLCDDLIGRFWDFKSMEKRKQVFTDNLVNTKYYANPENNISVSC